MNNTNFCGDSSATILAFKFDCFYTVSSEVWAGPRYEPWSSIMSDVADGLDWLQLFSVALGWLTLEQTQSEACRKTKVTLSFVCAHWWYFSNVFAKGVFSKCSCSGVRTEIHSAVLILPDTMSDLVDSDFSALIIMQIKVGVSFNSLCSLSLLIKLITDVVFYIYLPIYLMYHEHIKLFESTVP